MFDIGFAEVFLLSIIGLLVLGPERLPGVARTLGGFVRKARLSWYNLKRTVEAELAEAEAANTLRDAKREFESAQQEMNQLGQTLQQPLDGPAKTSAGDSEGPDGDAGTEPSEPQDSPQSS